MFNDYYNNVIFVEQITRENVKKKYQSKRGIFYIFII